MFRIKTVGLGVICIIIYCAHVLPIAYATCIPLCLKNLSSSDYVGAVKFNACVCNCHLLTGEGTIAPGGIAGLLAQGIACPKMRTWCAAYKIVVNNSNAPCD